MKSLIIPMAGKSTRFPNTRPKWMLTDPMSRDLMCVESIKGMNLTFFDKIYFTFLKSHENMYNISKTLMKCLEKNNLDNKSEFIILEESTQSQSETVYKSIIDKNINGFIFVKDSDCFFEIEIKSTENQIIYSDLKKTGDNTINNKSYILMDTNKIVENIVEKELISYNYCLGGYGFSSSSEFISFYKKEINLISECFISNVINKMISSGLTFTAQESSKFLDWGTYNSWKNYCSSFSTYFVDLDGTLLTHTSEFIPPYIGSGEPINENINLIKEKYSDGKCQIIITTARSENLRDITVQELKKHNIPYNHLIMGLPHAKRCIINDYSNTNSYPSAIAINIERNKEINFLP